MLLSEPSNILENLRIVALFAVVAYLFRNKIRKAYRYSQEALEAHYATLRAKDVKPSDALRECIERILLNHRDLIYEEVENDEVLIRRDCKGEIRDEDIVGSFLKDEFDAGLFDEMYIRRRIDEWNKENQRK